MDFVIVGIVIGAIIVGCGAAIRDIGPRLRPRLLRDDLSEVPPAKATAAWKRYCVAVGSLITSGGMLMVLVTVLGIIFDIDDSTGTNVVLASGVVALASIALAGLVVTPHYRRGGFLTRPDPALNLDERAIPIAAPDQPVDMPPDDPFAVDDVPAEPVLVTAPPPPMQDTVDDPRPLAEMRPEAPAAAAETLAPAPTQEPRRAAQWAEPEPEPSAERRRIRHRDPERPPRPTEPRPEPVGMRPTEPVPASPAFQVDATERKPVRYEPLDDDLPAWNAPVVQAPEPAPTQEIPATPQQRPEPRTGESGFASSLLADLHEPAEAEVVPTGPFKSRLLNELTSEATNAQPEPVIDVLLDEFSLPDDRQVAGADADEDQ